MDYTCFQTRFANKGKHFYVVAMGFPGYNVSDFYPEKKNKCVPCDVWLLVFYYFKQKSQNRFYMF